MRPRSVERVSLLRAAESLHAGPQGGGTFRELAQLAGVMPERARVHVDNMRRAGELVPVAEVRPEEGGKPLARYAPTSSGAQETTLEPDAADMLADVLVLWMR